MFVTESTTIMLLQMDLNKERFSGTVTSRITTMMTATRRSRKHGDSWSAIEDKIRQNVIEWLRHETTPLSTINSGYFNVSGGRLVYGVYRSLSRQTDQGNEKRTIERERRWRGKKHVQLENRGAVTRHCCGARRPIDHQSLPSFMRRSLPHDFGTPTPCSTHSRLVQSPSLSGSLLFPFSLLSLTQLGLNRRGCCASGQSRRSRGGSETDQRSVSPERVYGWSQWYAGVVVLRFTVQQTYRHHKVGEIEQATPCDVAAFSIRHSRQQNGFNARMLEMGGAYQRWRPLSLDRATGRHCLLAAQHRTACATHADAWRRDATLARNAVATVVILLPLFSAFG